MVVRIKPVCTVKFAPGFKFKLLQAAFELSITLLPLLRYTSVYASGSVLHCQLPGFSHAVFTKPVQVFEKISVASLLLIPLTRQRYLYPYQEEDILLRESVFVVTPL